MTTDLADRIEYTMWSVFKAVPGASAAKRPIAEEAEEYFAGLPSSSVTVRGLYRLSGLRADADWLVWWHAPTISALQNAYSGLRRTAWGRSSIPVWSTAGVHRPAEFNASHIPAYLHGTTPGQFLAVYPFVRSYEWYLLPADERKDMLANHGRAAHDFSDVLSNTVAAFGLGDYEWILALEADDPVRLVDLMRVFRATDARRHVREETPFFTGERSAVQSLIDGLP
ncbi:hydrogen peroxide-dependent heme synthase [Saccharopolyspora shandongensis]|uniref:hydrogen peroxide-dependent heme synthase n=1 Tax=Saccharopolyspora shandongensis TaxID=418495 RepID=UPI00340CCC2C